MSFLRFNKFFLFAFLSFLIGDLLAQNSPNTQNAIKPVELHMYGRLGVHSSLSGKNLGARLNLSGMAAIGGRLEENDYMEISPVFNVSHFANIEGPLVRFFLTAQVFSGDGTYIMYNTALNFSEAYLQVIDTTSGGKPWELWLGSRFYRSRTIDLIDYWDFDNLSGHGLGVKFHNTAFALISTVPFSEKSGNPYGYSGFNESEQKYVTSIKQKVQLGDNQDLFFIGEAHFATIDSVDSQNFTDSPFEFDDWGLIFGVQHHIKKGAHENYATIRYGNRIANGPGDDGWSSRTFITYGNPDKDNLQYQGAEGLNITEYYIFGGSQLFNLQAYATYRYAKGADDPLIDYTEFPNAMKNGILE